MAGDGIVIVGASLAGLRAAEELRRREYAERVVVIGAETHLPYDRPPLSKELLAGEWEPEQTSLRRQGFDDLGLDWRLGRRAVALDPADQFVTLDDGEKVSYRGCVIATGAAPRELPGTSELAGIHTLRTIDDCLAIRGELERHGSWSSAPASSAPRSPRPAGDGTST